MTGNQITVLVIIFLFIALIFIVTREIMLWYWKINDIVKRLDEIVKELKKNNVKKI